MTPTPFRFLSLALLATVALAACDATVDPPETADAADLTTAEVAEATEIVAEALAEDGGGLFASARDLAASFSPAGHLEDPRVVRLGGYGLRPPCQGDQSLSYTEETGTHVLGYRCGFQNATLQKGYVTRLSYQFRDAEAGYVPRPWNAWDAVDSVAFSGRREGFVKRLRGDVLRSESRFEQQGRWALSDLADDATPAVLAGRQVRTGTRIRATDNGRVSRTFSVEMSSREILIRESEDGLTHAASGELAYALTMEVVRGDRTVRRAVEGTITLEGNGRALVRVFGLGNVYRISLIDGETDRQA